MTILTIIPEISRTDKSLDDSQMATSFSSVEIMGTFITMEIIIQLTIRDSKFTVVMAITHHSTVNKNMAKKTRKKWVLKIFYKTVTRVQLGF